ncbi:LysR family transcriptional regulator [Acetonema longum]|uniref:LysR family transcriptional regulator n=1 Tax=Acetonema longum DSM 6540 TaxID=1009370 RepID=F7NG25_9FIRM|nr:LysR family transcriptional regulator [Acetonema longum]EGO64943.1 LysR family transcriptional regulator [Acetonema longum DSM 6540]
MEIRQLKTFISIVKLGNFSQAAQFLSYTQSTVTTHIQLLEKELNTLLFERFGQQTVLTEDGQRLYDYAEQIVRLEEDAKNVLNRSSVPRGPLIIGMPESLCVYRMPALLKEYSSLYPDVDLNLKFGTASDFRSLLRKNVMDIAFLLERSLSDSELDSTFLWMEPIVLIASPQHELVKANSIHPIDLTNQTFILGEASSCYRLAFEDILGKANIHVKTILEVGQIQAIKQLVLQNLGLTVLPLVAVHKELVNQELVALPWQGPEIKISAFLVKHKGKWVNHPMRAFIKLVREKLII